MEYITTDSYLQWISGRINYNNDNIDSVHTIELENITEIKLSEYNITIEKILNSLSIFKNLKDLSITDCSLTFLPDSIGNLVNLIKLSLTGNKLSSLPDSIGNLVNLKNLFISENNLSSLPNSIFQLSNLELLYIDSNDLSSLPNMFDKLVKLYILELNDNMLTSLPSSIFKLTNLNSLGLNKNRLSALPNNIGNLSNLETLGLDNNNLLSLPDTIGNLSNLQMLSLDYNNLNYLPDSIGKLSNLEMIILDNNDLFSLPDSIMNLTNLTYITVNNNAELHISDDIREFINRHHRVNNNTNNHNVAFEVHNAFNKINITKLFEFIEPYISLDDIDEIYDMDNKEFAEYMKNTLDQFIIRIPKKNIRRSRSQTDIENIFNGILNNLAYPNEYRKIISYCLKFASKQANEFKMEYASNFTYDCAHAYNSNNGNTTSRLSCAKGMIERFVFSFVPAAMLFIDTPLFKRKKYDVLISIIETKPKDLRGLIDQFAKDCYEEASNSEDDFKACLKRKLSEELKNSYNNTVVTRELDEYVPLLQLFGGAKRRMMKTRKMKCNKRMKSMKARKILHKSMRLKKKGLRRTKRV